jgi:hypothetical protein
MIIWRLLSDSYLMWKRVQETIVARLCSSKTGVDIHVFVGTAPFRMPSGFGQDFLASEYTPSTK